MMKPKGIKFCNKTHTIVVNFGRFPAMIKCPKLGIPLNGIFLRVNITYSTIAKENMSTWKFDVSHYTHYCIPSHLFTVTSH